MAPKVRQLFPAEINDPDRCQADGTGGEGQCRFMSVRGIVRNGLSEEYGTDVSAVETAVNCPKHKGGYQAQSAEKRRIYDYNVQQWEERLRKHAQSQNILTLWGELGVLRLTLESILQQCKNEQDLLLFSTRMSDLVLKIDKLVNSAERLESKRNLSLDRPNAINFASQVTDIVAEFVTPDELEEISARIIQALSDTIGG